MRAIIFNSSLHCAVPEGFAAINAHQQVQGMYCNNCCMFIAAAAAAALHSVLSCPGLETR